MNTETTGAEAPAVEGEKPEATAETPATATGQQSEAESGAASATETTGETTGDDAAEKEKRTKRFSGRISELVQQRNEAERRAERAEARLREAQNTDISALDYEDQIAEKTIQRSRKEQAENEREAAKDLAFEAFKAREALVSDKFADYSDFAHKGWEPTATMLEVILNSDNGPEIAYHLGKNPREVDRIAALSPTRQAAELGKLEVRVSAPRPLPKQPPAPVQPVNAIAAGGTKAPEDMSVPEYIAWRKANP